MADHEPHVFERHCDVAVVGGSAAGLAAALQLGRQRRSVIVVDDSEPRNATAAHLHGYLGHEAIAPAQLLAAGREEVRSYGGEVLTGRAVGVTRDDSGRFRVELAAGHVIVARRVLAATGLVDQLPDIDGLASHWGRDVIHCPFCHGYEVRDRRIVQIVTHPVGLHAAPLFRQLSDRLTVVLHDGVDDNGELDVLRAGGVTIVRGTVARVRTDDTGRVAAVELLDGQQIPADAVVVGPRFAARAEPFAALGLQPAPHPTGLGDVIGVDTNGETAVPGLYAAGNVTDPSHQVSSAAAHGSRVGAMISFSLADDDLRAATRASANEADWDQRYGGAQVWSGNPNGSLVNETPGLPPGRALDVGAGEGGDALWLAEQGWAVTANDVSRGALDRITAEAERRGLRIDSHHADANSLNAFPAAAFDLVSAMYAAIPRTPDSRGIHNLLDAVAPGGTLLVVSHDADAMRAALDTHGGQGFDAEAFVRVEDFAGALAESPLWEIGTHGKRPRPPGAATSAHHVDDIVLRARRAPTDPRLAQQLTQASGL